MQIGIWPSVGRSEPGAPVSIEVSNYKQGTRVVCKRDGTQSQRLSQKSRVEPTGHQVQGP